MTTTTIIQYQPYGDFPRWYTEDGFTDLLNAMTVNEKAELIKAEVERMGRKVFCEDCGCDFEAYERTIWLDDKAYCEDCFGSMFADMPLKDLVKKAELKTIEAIDG